MFRSLLRAHKNKNNNNNWWDLRKSNKEIFKRQYHRGYQAILPRKDFGNLRTKNFLVSSYKTIPVAKPNAKLAMRGRNYV